jgi:redox-sensitive bicupin YhaK (pirin superfamily)
VQVKLQDPFIIRNAGFILFLGMGNNKMLVEERSRDLGNFMVGRLLPFRKKRQVGPFTFIDHMGPTVLGPKSYADVDQHPHIGLSTLTYLLSGRIEHRDSTGAAQVISPGDVGFMTAGGGVSHTERTPEVDRGGVPFEMHGYQVWVAMPTFLEQSLPSFQFVAKEDLPKWQDGDLKFTLVAGEGFGHTSPLKVHSPLFMMDIEALADDTLCVTGALKGEIAIVVTHGCVREGEDEIGQGQMLISKTDDTCELRMIAGTRLLLFGGEPFPEERFLYWNFVSSQKSVLEQAKQDWAERKFPKVPGDDTYIPLP